MSHSDENQGSPVPGAHDASEAFPTPGTPGARETDGGSDRTDAKRCLRRIEEAARRFAAGERGHRVPVDGGAFGPLIEAFNRMAEESERMAIELDRRTAEHHTALEERNQALIESEARKSAILESALDAFITMDCEGTITEFNTAAERIFGYRKEDAVGRQLADLIVPAQLREQHREGLKRHVASGISRILGRQLELPAMRADGTEFPAEVAIVKVDGPGGKPFFTGYIRDLTVRKKAEESLKKSEEQLLHSQKMEAIGSLAGGVAHDFNNLLTAILGQAQLVLLKMSPDDPLRNRLAAIRDAGERGALLTQQLLAFSRKETAAASRLDLGEVVLGFQDLVRRVIGEDVAIRLEVGKQALPILADKGQVEQILLNLCVNARDAMPEGGTLTVSTNRVDATVEGHAEGSAGYAELRVADTGTGMSEETRRRMFEPFYTTKERGKGTGLGLSTVYGIVQQWSGTITVLENPAGGTIFRIRFPLDAAAAAPLPAKGRCPFGHGAPRDDASRAA